MDDVESAVAAQDGPAEGRSRWQRVRPVMAATALTATALAPAIAVATLKDCGTKDVLEAITGVVGGLSSGVLTEMVMSARASTSTVPDDQRGRALKEAVMARLSEIFEHGDETADMILEDLGGRLESQRDLIQRAFDDLGEQVGSAHRDFAVGLIELGERFHVFAGLQLEAKEILTALDRRSVLAQDNAKVSLAQQLDILIELRELRLSLPVTGTAGLSADTGPRPRRPVEVPYPGLASFAATDTAVFHGRDALTRHLLVRLDDQVAGPGVLVVTGASGSGKSSVLAAGLRAGMARGVAAPSSVHWPVLAFTPGDRPTARLGTELAAIGNSTGADVVERLTRAPRSVDSDLDQALVSHRRRVEQVGPQAPDLRVVIVVDQFEEVFTLCPDEADRAAFITALTEAGRHPHCCVVLALRSDFYPRCAEYPQLRPAFEAGPVIVGALDRDGLRHAIERPAAAAGLRLEEGFTDLLLDDLSGSPDLRDDVQGESAYEAGRLPLLAHALRETWERRTGNVLTTAGYRDTGGIDRAVAESATAVYQSLTPQQQLEARSLLLRLVTPGADGSQARRRAPMTELVAGHGTDDEGPDEIRSVLDHFVAARLITTGEDGVEITHEALLRAWPLLGEWVDEDREGLRLHHEIAQAATAWQDLSRDPSALYRGLRLQVARRWAESHDARLNPDEKSFLATSLAAQEAEDAAGAQRRTRLRALGAALVVVLILLGGTSAFWVAQARANDRQAAEAASRRLAGQANVTNGVNDVNLSVGLAVAAFRQADTLEARDALVAAANSHILTRAAAHTGRVLDVAVSPDGGTLASVGDDGLLRLWRASDMRPLDRGQLVLGKGDAGVTFEVVFSPDGKLLATAGAAGALVVWDVARQVTVAQLAGHDGGVKAVAFSADGKWLASGGEDRTVRLWSVGNFGTTSPKSVVAKGHSAMVQSVEFAPDSRSLYSGSDDATVRRWSVPDLEPVATFGPQKTSAFAVAVSPDGKTVVSADQEEYSLTVWDVAKHEQVRVLTGHGWSTNAAAFSPDGELFVSASRDGTVRIWETRRWKRVEYRFVQQNGVQSLAITPDSRRLVTGSADGTVATWSVDLLVKQDDGVNGVAWSPDGTRLVAGSDDSTAVVYAADGSVVQRLRHDGAVRDVAYSRDGLLIATSSADGTLRVWDARTFRLVATVPTGDSELGSFVTFSPDGRLLATSSGKDEALVVDVATHKVRYALKNETYNVNEAAFSPDGRLLATANGDNTVGVYDVASGKRLRTLVGHTGFVQGVAFTPDGRNLLSAAGDKAIRIWRVSDGEQVGQLIGHPSTVRALAVSPDGALVASLDAQGATRLWDLTTRSALTQLGKSLWPVNDVAFSPDGRRLAVAGHDAVHLWQTAYTGEEELVDRLCRAVGTGLSDFQRQQYLTGIPIARQDDGC